MNVNFSGIGGKFSLEISFASVVLSCHSIVGFSIYSASLTYPIVVFVFKVNIWPPWLHNAMINSSGNLSPTPYNNGRIVILGCSFKRKGFSSISISVFGHKTMWSTTFNSTIDTWLGGIVTVS